jgi:hypothetical protein
VLIKQRTDFTAGAELPAAITVGPLPDGKYYVDNDKSYDLENVLSDFVCRSFFEHTI